MIEMKAEEKCFDITGNKLVFSFKMQGGGSGLRLNNRFYVTIVSWNMMIVFGWTRTRFTIFFFSSSLQFVLKAISPLHHF